MYSLNKDLEESNVCLSYLGTFTDEITDKLISISEFYLDNQSEIRKLKNKVSFLIAECFQNIVRHKEPDSNTSDTKKKHSDFFQINVLNDRAILTSCNLIPNKFVSELEKKLIQVNSLDSDGLKKLYNEVLENSDFSEKGGAGLGLIEMARKSGLPLKYSFIQNEDQNFSSFFLSLEIINNKDNPSEKVNLSEIENFYSKLTKNKVMMLYKGDLSKEFITPLVEMVQSNFSDQENISGKEKRSVIALIESLQNISKHGKITNSVKEGIFTLQKINDTFIINVGNSISKENSIKLKETLKLIKSKNPEEIKKLYLKKLVDPEITEEGNCGLGLLEIAKNSNGNFEYNFTPQEADVVFYSIKMSI